MTVEEAKAKVCPFMSNHVANATDLTLGEVNCICGGCMAWVYTKHEAILNEDELDKSFKTYIKMSTSRMESYMGVDVKYTELPEDEKEGYCKRLS
jgi:hypothetical protein